MKEDIGRERVGSPRKAGTRREERRTEDFADFFHPARNIFFLDSISHWYLVIFVEHFPQPQSVIIITLRRDVQYSSNAKVL
jgi:hypothetical protein